MDPTNPDVLLAVGASAPAPHLDADPRRTRERPAQVHRRRHDVAAHSHRPARRRSRPHRARVLAGAEGPGLRQGRDRPRTRSRSTRRTTPATAGSGAATSRRSRCTTRTSIPIRRTPIALYVPTVQTQISDDGGRTFRSVGERNKHVDNHYIWIDPDNTDHLLEGCDGGLYETWDRRPAVAPLQQPVGDAVLQRRGRQRVADLQHLRRHAGQQHARRPVALEAARTASTNNDWFIVTGGDGFVARIDPDGSEHRLRRVAVRRHRAARSAHQRARQHPPGGRIAASRRCASTGNRRSSSARTARRGCTSAPAGCSAATIAATRGKPVSPDLTRQTDRNMLPVMGRIWPPEAVAQHQSTATWGNISALSESRKREGLLYVGTDDGLVQLSLDGGANWRQERAPARPARLRQLRRLRAAPLRRRRTTRTSSTRCSRTPRTATSSRTSTRAPTAAARGDRSPATCRPTARCCRSPKITSIPTCCSSAPSSACSSPSTAARSGFACAATCRRSRCATWRSRSARTISCSATFGRGFYVLDDYSPLRQLSQADLRSRRPRLPDQAGGDRSAGDRHARAARRAKQLWMGENRPLGAHHHLLGQGGAADRCGSAARTQRARRGEEGVAALSDAGRAHRGSGRRSAADVPDRSPTRPAAWCGA